MSAAAFPGRLVLALALVWLAPAALGAGRSAGSGALALRRGLRAAAVPLEGRLRRLAAPTHVVDTQHGMHLSLRGGSGGAETAATEEEEHDLSTPPVRAVAEDGGAGDEAAPAASVEDKLRKHLAAVEANPADYIAHPEPGTVRFRVCDAAALERKPRGVASATAELLVTRRRNAWQRFYPLDLALLLPDVLDTEEVFDEEGEMGQARNLAATGETPSGALTSVVSPWAWATQRVKFRDGSTGTARLLFAQESTGVIMWSLQRGAAEPIVERVHISDERSTPNGPQVALTWTSGARAPCRAAQAAAAVCTRPLPCSPSSQPHPPLLPLPAPCVAASVDCGC